MPLTTPNFTTTESIASPSQITFTDTSVGSDGTLTNRQIYCKLANGNWLTTAGESTTEVYENWTYSDSSIVLDLITQSTVATVTVKWLAGTSVLYTKVILSEWDLYDYLFLFGLLSAQTSFPAVNDNTGYWPNSFMMITNLFQSEQAVTLMDDLYSSQSALNRNQYMIDNQNFFF